MASDTGDVQIPIELGQRLRALCGLDAAPPTLERFLAALAASSFVPSPDQLCATGTSRHRVTIGGRRLYMNCVLDAVLLPLLTGESAEIASESPVSGSVVRARVSPAGIEIEPPEAVVSFGVARDEGIRGSDALCPYINAFVSTAEYNIWAERTPDAIIVMVPMARAYVLGRDYLDQVPPD